jgi:hypothetical protein
MTSARGLSTLALDEPELSPRELAVLRVGNLGLSPAQALDLITSPAFILMKAADEFKDKRQRRTNSGRPLHLSEGDRLGLVLLVDGSRRLLSLCLEALHHDESQRCHRHLGVGLQVSGLEPRQRGLSASSAIRQRPVLRLGGAGGMARQTRRAAYPRRALSSNDADASCWTRS